MIKIACSVMIGGGIGSVLRWLLSNRFNALFPTMPLGTLIANTLAGMIIGAAFAAFSYNQQIDPVWKLFITTGLCGGLSTFSTFSIEVFSLLQQQNWLWAGLIIFFHLFCSLLAVAMGYFLVKVSFF